MTQFSHLGNQHEALNEQLKQAFPFTDEDLAINRSGKLAEAQKVRLRQHRGEVACMGWGCGLIGVVSVCALIINTVLMVGHNDSNNIFLVAIGVALCLILSVLHTQWQITRELKRSRVESACGEVERRMTSYRGSNTYYVALDEKQFHVSRKVYEAFTDNQKYILYYTPGVFRLVAAEHVLKLAPIPQALGE